MLRETLGPIVRAALLAQAVALCMASSVAAQSTESTGETSRNSTETPKNKSAREQELEAIRAEKKLADEAEGRLKLEIAMIGEDRRKLNQALIDAAGRVRAIETQVPEIERRLETIDFNQKAIQESLHSRRALIAEILAALQRVGRRHPPALLSKPEDALQMVRTAMLLGAVLPNMHLEVDLLAFDLSDLIRLRWENATERETLAKNATALAEDRRRMTLLLEERQKQQNLAEKALENERQRAGQLGRQADNLLDLIAKLEKDSGVSARAAEAARGSAKVPQDGRAVQAALKDSGRLTPALAFSAAKGLLPLPVNGVRLRNFGVSDGLGGAERGLSIATRSGAQVTAPCDGWVVYAGPFRSYGQLLILNAGGGYHVLLAGMEKITAEIGQFVLTGEPVALMGGGPQAASVATVGSTQPIMYVEFRKDGVPIDPNPWWALKENEKVRG